MARPVHDAARKASEETRLPLLGLPALRYGGERAEYCQKTCLMQYSWRDGECGQGTLVVGRVRLGSSRDNSQGWTEQGTAPCAPLSSKS